jgi:hypothetical protein
MGKGWRERYSGGDLTNVPYKHIWNCHNEFPLYNKYILIKKNFKRKGLPILNQQKKKKSLLANSASYFKNSHSVSLSLSLSLCPSLLGN